MSESRSCHQHPLHAGVDGLCLTLGPIRLVSDAYNFVIERRAIRKGATSWKAEGYFNDLGPALRELCRMHVRAQHITAMKELRAEVGRLNEQIAGFRAEWLKMVRSDLNDTVSRHLD